MESKNFIEVSQARCESPDAFNMPNISLEFLMLCLTEELGEVAGPMKKLARGFNKRELLKTKRKSKANGRSDISDDILKLMWEMKNQNDMRKEFVDLFIYLLMAMKKAGVTKKDIIDKFNEVSKEMGPECQEQFTIDETIKIEYI